MRKLIGIEPEEPHRKTAGEEGLHMKRIMKESMGDCSTLEEFRFLVRCGECGRTWRSTPVRFSKAGVEPKTEAR